jgi:tetratricopeptide (TPR) repeat protein
MVGADLERILSVLDAALSRNDYAAAERHLRYWLEEAVQSGNIRIELPVRNELMGLLRKLGRKEDAMDAADAALRRLEALGAGEQVGAATTYLNAATVRKAFGHAEEALPLLERARAIYERELEPNDVRLAGLYNNTGLALVDVGRFEEANELYRRAIALLAARGDGEAEQAISYLNLASSAEAEQGLLEADEIVQACLKQAQELLERCPTRDGAYAFACEKCASVFGYYGHFAYERTLRERARRIYEGT